MLPHALAALVLLNAPPARPGGTPATLADLARDIKAELEARSETRMNLGAFSGPSQATNGGPGLAQKLTKLLEVHKIAVGATGAKLTLKAEFSQDDFTPAGATKTLVALKVEAKLVDPRGKAVKGFDVLVTDEQTILESFGAAVELPPTPSATPNFKRDPHIRRALDDPPAPKIDGGEAKSPQGAFGLAVVVAGQVRAAQPEGPHAFVQLARGEQYAVRLSNHSERDVVADLSIDGVNVFEFSELKDAAGRPKFRTYLVPAGKSLDIPGWHKDLATAFRFEVGGYADSAAARLAKAADSSDIGQITAVFRAAWPKGTQPPAGEGVPHDAEGNATKLGPPTEFNTKAVELEFGNVCGSACVRYAKPAK